MEYHNDEKLIKSRMSGSYEPFSLYLESMKKESKQILNNHTKNQHRCP